MSQNSERADNHKDREDLIPSAEWGGGFTVDAETIAGNLLEIKNEIAPCKPKIIGVTKYYGRSSIINGYEAGLRDFGESRALEAIEKIKSLPEEIRKNSAFHFIGHLQTNKAEKVVSFFDVIHSVDSLKIAVSISEAACRLNKREKVLLQVNNAKEEQKFGYTVERLKSDFPELLKLRGIEIIGLMNMATLGADESVLHELFGGLRKLRDELENEFNVALPELSMGMSDDYLVAVEEGATVIRIGRKLFT